MAWVPARIDQGTSPPIFAVPNVAKWLLAFGMLASRPEITILFLPFTAVYWRD
jgi:Trk-type K+ transport system membrane component